MASCIDVNCSGMQRIQFIDDSDLVEQEQDSIKRILHEDKAASVEFPFVPGDVPGSASSAPGTQDAACSPTTLPDPPATSLHTSSSSSRTSSHAPHPKYAHAPAGPAFRPRAHHPKHGPRDANANWPRHKRSPPFSAGSNHFQVRFLPFPSLPILTFLQSRLRGCRRAST